MYLNISSAGISGKKLGDLLTKGDDDDDEDEEDEDEDDDEDEDEEDEEEDSKLEVFF